MRLTMQMEFAIMGSAKKKSRPFARPARRTTLSTAAAMWTPIETSYVSYRLSAIPRIAISSGFKGLDNEQGRKASHRRLAKEAECHSRQNTHRKPLNNNGGSNQTSQSGVWEDARQTGSLLTDPCGDRDTPPSRESACNDRQYPPGAMGCPMRSLLGKKLVIVCVAQKAANDITGAGVNGTLLYSYDDCKFSTPDCQKGVGGSRAGSCEAKRKQQPRLISSTNVNKSLSKHNFTWPCSNALERSLS